MSGLIFLAQSANGAKVYYDPVHSHTATHFADTPGLQDLCKEIIQRTKLQGVYQQFDVDFGRVVGRTDLVENEPGDIIVWAKRLNRDVYTSFNKSKPPQACSFATVAFERRSNDTYELVSAWIGRSDSPPFPGDPHATAESKPYWLHHSLAWGTQAIQPGTEITDCPW